MQLAQASSVEDRIEAKLKRTAQVLGSATFFGSGLVNATAATTGPL